MIVRELIEGAVWRPGRDYAGAEPIVSVLLPTYRRAASGRFRRAAESVLAQTLEALELIIIDDGSTDGTAQQIEQLMDEDGRVSCITHRQNVGLPALSIYEGYARASAPYLGFAFDDFVFRRTALERLAKAAVRSQADVLHGYARVINPRGRAWLLGRRGTDFISYERLRQQNVIPNAAVLLRKTVVDVVGWFDPHVCLVRACDFDYWGRLARRYVIEYEPVNVGTEFGPSLSDSLGNTHPWDLDETFELMGCDRNHLLTPAAFLERIVV
jgi:glycosyltransferase involved in cell wall biosynthesis